MGIIDQEKPPTGGFFVPTVSTYRERRIKKPAQGGFWVTT
jgi:hypothetical protein